MPAAVDAARAGGAEREGHQAEQQAQHGQEHADAEDREAGDRPDELEMRQHRPDDHREEAERGRARC